MKISINPVALAHRALALLPQTGTPNNIAFYCIYIALDGALSLKWRVVEHTNEVVGKLPIFSIKSNARDKPHAGPPHFASFKLRREQLRSLSWMLQQESSTSPFVEEDVVEGPVSQLGWRLEVWKLNRIYVGY